MLLMESSSSSSSSSCFTVICLLHSIVAITSGSMMIFYRNEVFIFSHGQEIANKLTGTTAHDQLLIQTSDSFSGLLLFSVGFLLFMVAFVKEREFQSFFAKGCVILHISMAVWRTCFERKLDELGNDWVKQALGDISLGLSWVFLLLYWWREKYD